MRISCALWFHFGKLAGQFAWFPLVAQSISSSLKADYDARRCDFSKNRFGSGYSARLKRTGKSSRD